jgi:cellobiose phosphorylase
MVYTSGRNGLGYRDTVQDIQGIMHLDPNLAGQRLRLMLSGQLSSGGALPLVPFDFEPGTAIPPEDPRSHESYRCDDHLWLFPTINMYISETGSHKFLEEVIPYGDTGEDTVYEHLRRAINFSLKRSGEHGLVLGLHADWNDCLRLGEKGESVFASLQLFYGINLFEKYAKLLKKDADVTWAKNIKNELDTNLKKYAWEGDRFVRAFSTVDGVTLGSEKNDEGKIFLNTQSWGVLSGALDKETGTIAMESARKKLDTDYGLMLCYPSFRNYGLPVVRSILFLPGVKENGGIFSHTQGWAVLAEALLGRGNRAWEIYNRANPARMNDQAQIRELEPYVHGQFTEGTDSPFHGRSQNHWLTGTASTMMVGAVQGILGIRPDVSGIIIDPSIPASWDGFEARREFRGKVLYITVKNPEHVENGVVEVVINGKSYKERLIKDEYLKDGENTVTVVMGVTR